MPVEEVALTTKLPSRSPSGSYSARASASRVTAGRLGATAGSLAGALVDSPAQLQMLFLAFFPVFALFAWQHRRHGQAARLFNEPSRETLK